MRIYKMVMALILLLLAFMSAEGLRARSDATINANIEKKIDQPDAAVVVTMTNRLNFKSDTVVIEVGQTVKWKNTSLLVHTVTADPEKATKESSASLPKKAEPFDSGNLKPDQSFTHTFEKPGTYHYFCIPHEAAMTGTVIVKKQDH